MENVEVVYDQNIQPVKPALPETSQSSKFTNWPVILAVVVAGVVLLGTIGYLVFQVCQLRSQTSETELTTRITITPTPTSTRFPLTPTNANWKVFQSKKFSYRMEYPPEMKLGGRPHGAPDYYDDVSFSLIKETGKNGEMVDGLSINVRSQDNPQKLPLRDWLDNQDRGESVVNGVVEFPITGLNAIRVFGQGMYPFDEIIIPQDSRVLIIQGAYVEKDEGKYKEIYERILSTFKFTD